MSTDPIAEELSEKVAAANFETEFQTLSDEDRKTWPGYYVETAIPGGMLAVADEVAINGWTTELSDSYDPTPNETVGT